MQVLKFGGTSVADAANMSKVVDIVCKAASESDIWLQGAMRNTRL